jgi:WD40 repeat protein
LPVTEAAQLVAKLATALAHLHAQGLVHRDVKPSNIIFVRGQPKLADIGLVTGAGDSRSFVGTEGFIAPEGPGSTQADVYSLGKLLFELVTGRDRMEFPRLPADLARLPEREGILDLNEVITRACALTPGQRYATAAQMDSDLRSFLAGRSLREARKTERHLVRLRWFAVAASVVTVFALGGLWLASSAQRRANEREQQSAARVQTELELRTRAEGAERAAHEQLYAALLEQARATVRSGELGQRLRTLDTVRRAAAMRDTVELRREAFAALALPDLCFERELPLAPDVTMKVLDPKFERLAVGRGTKAVEIRSVPEQRLLATLEVGAKEPVTLGKWSADGRFLAIRRGQQRSAANKLTQVDVWDVSSNCRVLSLPRTSWTAFSFHPTLPRILGGDVDGFVSEWDLESGRETARFAVAGLVYQLEFSPDGKSFVAQHRIGTPWFTSLFDTTTGEVLRKSESNGWIDGVAWHPKGRWVALAARDGEVGLYDPRNGQMIVLGRHKREARTTAFSHDGNFLFTGGEEQEIICWDLRQRQRAFTIRLRTAEIQFEADGPRCALHQGTSVLLHSLERSSPCRELTGDLGGSLGHGAFSPDGRWLAVGGAQGLGLWDLSHEGLAAITTEPKNATPFFSPDGAELFAFWVVDFARWRITAGPTAAAMPRLTTLPVYKPGRVYSAGFAADELVLGTLQGAVMVPSANIATGPGELFEIGYANARISPNGSWLAFRKNRPHFEQVYRRKPWDGIRFLKSDAEVLAEAFTPRSDELAVATATSVTFFDTKRWQPGRRFAVSLDRNAELIFAADGGTFWLVNDANNAALHHTRTFEMLLPLPAGTIPLAVSPDGTHLAVSVNGRSIQVWDLDGLGKCFAELGIRLGARQSD